MHMRAESRFIHDGKPLRPGDEFDIDDGDGADLRAMGLATPIQSLGQALTEAADNAKNILRRNTYRRRDLKAAFSEEVKTEDVKADEGTEE